MVVYVKFIKEYQGAKVGEVRQVLEGLAKKLFENGFIEDPFPAAAELKKKSKSKDASDVAPEN